MTPAKELLDVRPAEHAPPADYGERAVQGTWARNAWLLFAFLVLAFLSHYVWPRYIDLDPSKTFAMLRPDFPAHYSIVVAHVLAGNVAFLTAGLQLWPWLRERHPAAHRFSGRLYVFAGAIPCSLLAVPLLVLKGQAATTSPFFWAAAWIVTTIAGYRMARRHRYAEHLRWMAYSIAIGAAIIWNGVVGDLALKHPDVVNLRIVFDLLIWVPGVANLLLAHVLVNRALRRGVAARRAPVGVRP